MKSVALVITQAAEYGGAVKLLSSCGPAVATCTFQGNNASSGGAVYVAAYGSNGTCTDGDPCQCPPAEGPVLSDVRNSLLSDSMRRISPDLHLDYCKYPMINVIPVPMGERSIACRPKKLAAAAARTHTSPVQNQVLRFVTQASLGCCLDS